MNFAREIQLSAIQRENSQSRVHDYEEKIRKKVQRQI